VLIARREVKKLKRLIGRSVVHGQHGGAGGVPVHFLGDRQHRGSAQRGRYVLGAYNGNGIAVVGEKLGMQHSRFENEPTTWRRLTGPWFEGQKRRSDAGAPH
jgi:hypothetical protein